MKLADRFYEDEVIEGFYVPSMMKKAWGAQMDVLAEVDAICERHNIPYFADWGSLLGALRHGGYVPWDDDLDICMRRKDYDRFLEYAKDELPEGFKVMNYKTQEGHLFFVARVVGKPRICFEKGHLERFKGFPYIAGLDLFILDNVYKDREKEKLKSKKAEFVIALADQIADGSLQKSEIEPNLKLAEKYTGEMIDRGLKGEQLRVRMYELAEKLFSMAPDDESDALVQMMPYGMYNHHLYIPKKYYENTVRLPFMHTTIPVPACFDEVMKMKYGNYMLIHRKWDGHDYPFFDGQHKDLLAVLDFEYPRYKITGNDFRPRDRITKEKGIKEITGEYVNILRELIAKAKGNRDIYVDIQNVAVEMGTYIEEVYGEGTKTVSLLEKLCESCYLGYETFSQNTDIDEVLAQVDELRIREIRDRKEIVFMPFSYRYFQYMRPLYESYMNNPEYEVAVVPIPYYYKNYDGTFGKQVYDISDYPEEIKAIDYRSYNHKARGPEIIVIDNPFDEWNSHTSVLPEYYSRNLIRYTKELVYIPFFDTDDFVKEQECEYRNMDYYVCVPGVVNADRVILPSEMLKNTYIQKLLDYMEEDEEDALKEASWLLSRKITAEPGGRRAGGLSNTISSERNREELLAMITKRSPEEIKGLMYGKDGTEKVIIAYMTSGAHLISEGESVISKIERVMELAEKTQDRILFIFNGCFGDVKSLDFVDKKVIYDYDRIIWQIRQKGGIVTDYSDRESFLAIAELADAYYGTPSPLARAFQFNNKPVMVEDIRI